MTRDRLLSALRRWCRRNGPELRVDTLGGKGSHTKVRVGAKATIIKSGDLSPQYVELILKQLGLPKEAI